MKLRHGLLSAVAWAALLSPALPAEMTPAEVTGVMEDVADWQLTHPSKWKPLEWHNAPFYSGLMALAKVSASPRFRDKMIQFGETHGWQLGPRPYHADDHAVGQMYLEAYALQHDPRALAPMRERFDAILAQPRDGSLDFDRQKNPDRLDRWSWCDSLFMSPTVWIGLWQATGKQAYLDFAVAHWWATSDFLYDKDEHLYYRDSSYFGQAEKNGRKVFWGRGNGWVMAGLVRVLSTLPADHPARARFVQQFREMADKVLTCQQADGFWRASLLDPASYPMQETSGTGFYCYAFAWGVNEGLLDRARFAPAARRAWAALVSCVKPDGRLTHVQPVGATPVTFDAESSEPYGVGAFLLAGSEVRRLASP